MWRLVLQAGLPTFHAQNRSNDTVYHDNFPNFNSLLELPFLIAALASSSLQAGYQCKTVFQIRGFIMIKGNNKNF
jgi:hypothetical protein